MAVDYYADNHHVSMQEATRRLQIESKVPDLEQQLQTKLKDGFSQLWFDNDAGRFVVALSPTGSREDAAALLEDVGLPSTQIVSQSFSYLDLAAAYRATLASVRDDIASGHAQLGVGNGSITLLTDAAVSSDGLQQAVDLSSQTRVPLSVTKGDIKTPTANACYRDAANGAIASQGYCDTFVGAAEWYNSAGYTCSLGFVAYSPVDTAHLFGLTAGHCVKGMAGMYFGQPWYSCKSHAAVCGTFAGVTINGNWGGGDSDYGVLRIDAGNAVSQWVNWWNGSQTHPTYAHNVWNGETVCHNGYRTGSSCGTVTNSYMTVNEYLDATHTTTTPVGGLFQTTDTIAHGGDSGGPWTDASDPHAVGLMSAGGDGGVTYGTNIGLATSNLNVQVITW